MKVLSANKLSEGVDKGIYLTHNFDTRVFTVKKSPLVSYCQQHFLTYEWLLPSQKNRAELLVSEESLCFLILDLQYVGTMGHQIILWQILYNYG